MLIELFADLGLEHVKYRDLEINLKVKFQKNAVSLTNAQVIEFIAFYRQNNYLKETGGRGRQGNQYFINKSIPV